MASNDNPDIAQLEDMIEFCGKHKNLYIWGTKYNSQMLGKYLDMCGKGFFQGYVVSDGMREEGDIPAYTLSEVMKLCPEKKQTGFLMAVSDKWTNEVLKTLSVEGYGLHNVHILSEYNKRTIAYKMTPRPRERMWIEVNLADHCNLNCQMCDHFSQLAKPFFLDLERFRRDMARLSELSEGHIGILKLQGGEPLLNTRLIEFIKTAREYFPKTLIFLFTNGLLLKKWEKAEEGNLWQACHDYNIWVELTAYPIKLKIDEIKELSEKYDVHLRCFSEVGERDYSGIKHSVKHPFRLGGDVEPWQFISCYQFNECITLREGKLYTCPIIPYIGHFNSYFNQNLQVTANDYLDIYEPQSYGELAEFVTHRTDFCRYCDVKNRRAFEWNLSEHTINEYVD